MLMIFEDVRKGHADLERYWQKTENWKVLISKKKHKNYYKKLVFQHELTISILWVSNWVCNNTHKHKKPDLKQEPVCYTLFYQFESNPCQYSSYSFSHYVNRVLNFYSSKRETKHQKLCSTLTLTNIFPSPFK